MTYLPSAPQRSPARPRSGGGRRGGAWASSRRISSSSASSASSRSGASFLVVMLLMGSRAGRGSGARQRPARHRRGCGGAAPGSGRTRAGTSPGVAPSPSSVRARSARVSPRSRWRIKRARSAAARRWRQRVDRRSAIAALERRGGGVHGHREPAQGAPRRALPVGSGSQAQLRAGLGVHPGAQRAAPAEPADRPEDAPGHAGVGRAGGDARLEHRQQEAEDLGPVRIQRGGGGPGSSSPAEKRREARTSGPASARGRAGQDTALGDRCVKGGSGGLGGPSQGSPS